MQAISVLNTVTEIVAPGNVAFIHIQNFSDENIFICYDGGQSGLTIATGIVVRPNAIYELNNDGTKPLFNKGVYAIAENSGKEVRVQGA